MDSDLAIRSFIYDSFVARASAPTFEEIAAAMRLPTSDIRIACGRLAAGRMIVLTSDGESIRMALPFSAIPTQHQVLAHGKTYFANCAWDSFGIPAALHAEAEVLSRCEQTHEPLRLRLTPDGPRPSSWVFHAAVPAARWWRDIVYT